MLTAARRASQCSSQSGDFAVFTGSEKAAYQVENHYVSSCVSHTPFDKVLAPMFATVATYRERIRPEVFPPRVRWER